VKIIQGFALLITAFALGLGNQIAQTPPREEILARQLKEVDLDNVTLVNALTRTLSAAQVPGGIVITTICGDQPKYVVTPSGPTLGDALNSIVTVAPQYRWYVQKGVVNLTPASGNPPLLDLRIAEFKVTGPRTVEETVGQLLKMPKVQEGIARLNLVSGGGHIGISELHRPGSELEKKAMGSHWIVRMLRCSKY